MLEFSLGSSFHSLVDQQKNFIDRGLLRSVNTTRAAGKFVSVAGHDGGMRTSTEPNAVVVYRLKTSLRYRRPDRRLFEHSNTSEPLSELWDFRSEDQSSYTC